jgi:glycerol kinase
LPSQYILAIDQGTTGSRALFYDVRGEIKSQAYREFRQYYPRPGWVEHNASEILTSIQTVIRQAMRAGRISARQIAAIGVTNQRETVVVWNRQTGKPLGRAIVWQDRRTEALCQLLKKQGFETDVRRRTGLFFDPYFSGSKLRWLFEQDPRLGQMARAGKLCVGTMDSWILFHLTGRQVHATDFTNASRTLLFNIQSMSWDPRLVRLFRVPKGALPKALPSNANFGQTKNFKPLPNGIPIHAMIGDQQSALFGQGCYSRGTSKNTYGTGCFLLVNLGKRLLRSRSGVVTTVACDEKGDPAYAMEASIFIAGAAIQWLRDGLKLIKKAPETEQIARRTRELSDVVVIPAFTGLGAPHWRPDVRAAIMGITRGTTRDMITKATLDSVALQVCEVFDVIRKESKIRIPALKVDGGASQNAYLMQLQADLLGVPILQSNTTEATAWGAAKLAGLSCGFWRTPRKVDQKARYKWFRPKMRVAERNALVSRWDRAIRQLTAPI